MGVPKFFRWLSERYPVVNQRLGRVPKKETILEHYGELPETRLAAPDPLSVCSVSPEIDHLYIDMNGIIHGCSHNNNSADDDTEAVNEISEAEIFTNICYYLDRIVKDIVQPQKLVYMAIDGVAPRAKLNQQRSRRYRSCNEGLIETTVFDAHKKKLQEQQSQQPHENNHSVSPIDSDESSEDDEDDQGIEEVEPGRFSGKIEGTVAETELTEAQFHSNSITPGTPFFSRCTAHIEHFIKYKLSTDDAWKNLEVIFSGPNTPGEGEHKIMQFIREQRQCSGYNPNLRHCIMGQDGDLIMLGLITHEPNLVLLREQVIFDAKRRDRMERAVAANPIHGYIHNSNFEYLHMNVLRDYFAYEFETSNVVPGSPWDIEQCLDDFVFLTYFVGNDFLPHMPAMDIADEAFDLLFYTYRSQRKSWRRESPRKKPYLVYQGKIVCGKRLQKFLQVLGRHELSYFEFKKSNDDLDQERKLQEKYGMNTIPSDEVLAVKEASDREQFRERIIQKRDASHVPGFKPVLSARPTKTDNEEELTEHMGNLLKIAVGKGKEFEVYDQDLKGRYYSDKFGFGPFDADKHVKLRESYIEGLVWNLRYYFEGCPSWEWYYPYHYGPMLSDLVDVDKMLSRISFKDKKGTPLRPFEQLLSCMPPSHAEVLPEPYRGLMTDPNSPIVDFYPLSFTIDMNGKRWPWEAVVLLPFIDSPRLLEAVSKVDENQLTAEELSRNATKPVVVYKRDPSQQHHLAAVSDGPLFGALENCNTVVTDFDSTRWKYKGLKKPVLRPILKSGVETPLPGFPTLRDGSVVGLWRKSLKVNIHGNPSRYKTACLEIENPLPEVLSTEILGEYLIGRTVWINYPHFLQGFVTAVSDAKGFIRGKHGSKVFWNTEEAAGRKIRVQRIVDNYVFGEKLVGTGGISLVGGEDVMNNVETLLYVRPFGGLKTTPDGTTVKTFSKFEMEVPLFVTGWAPQRMDKRLANLPLLLEEDPFNATKNNVITCQESTVQNAVSQRKRFGRRFAIQRNTISDPNRKYSAARSFSTMPGAQHSVSPATFSTGAPLVDRHQFPGKLSCRPMNLGTQTGSVQLGLKSKSNLRGLKIPTRPQSFVPKRSAGSFLFGAAFLACFFLGTEASDHGLNGLLEGFQRFDRLDSNSFPSYEKTAAARPSQNSDSLDGLPFESENAPPLEFLHGTTTLSFTFGGGIVAAVDSRASQGSFVGSKTVQKVLPINSHVLGTMAGGAADCSFWIRKLRCEASMFELNEGRRMSVARASSILANSLYQNRHFDLSVGTMIMGFDDEGIDPSQRPKIFYVDNTGARVEGELFSVGSGSTLALGILDREWRYDLTVDEAVALGIKAIRYATFRDAFSGGYINVYLITAKHGWKRVFTEDLDCKVEAPSTVKNSRDGGA